MKKIFALLVVVAMLAVAGSAFAATGGHGTDTGGTTEKTGEVSIVTQVVVKVVEVVQKTVTVISQTAQKSAVVETFTEVTQTITQKVTTTVLEKVEGFTTALAQTWAAKAAEVEQKKETAKASSAVQSALKTGAAANIDATPKPASKLKPVEKAATDTTPTVTKTAEEKLAAATDALGITGAAALSATDPVTPEETGAYDFPKTFGKNLYGTKIAGNRGAKGAKAGNAFYTAAADNDGIVFLNSSGDQISTIPGDENSADIMPGFVNMVVLMEAGEVYEPVIYATAEALSEAGVETASVTVSIDVTEATTQTIITDENGNVTVVEEASDAELSALATKFGVASLKSIPATAYASVSSGAVGSDPDQYIAYSLPAFNDLEDGTYYYGPFSFDVAPNADSYDVPADALMTFYPAGFTSTEKPKKLFQTSDGDTYTEVTTTSADVLFGTTGNYIVFTVSGSDLVTVSDVDGAYTSAYSMSAPILAVSVSEKDGGDDDQTIGSSGGGCSTGISVLGLAVLGLFAAKRKK